MMTKKSIFFNKKKIIQTKSEKIYSIILFLLFSTFLTYWFYNNSYIRPTTIHYNSYKEIVSALLLLFIIFLNYFILAPLYFKKKNYRGYIFLSLFLIAFSSFSELFVVKNDILKCVGFQDKALIDKYLRHILYILFLRNAGFYLFFTMLKLYLQTISTAIKEKKAVLNDAGLVLFTPHRGEPTSININFISYFSQSKNNTFIHHSNGKTTTIYSSLSYIQSYLGSLCLRINKDNIVTFTNIISYDNESVAVKAGKANQTVALYYSKSIAQNILHVLRNKIPEMEKKNAQNQQKSENGNLFDDENIKIGNVKKEILEKIKRNPGNNAKKLFEFFPKESSLRTFRRRLRDLSDSNLIVFKGSSKTGGYYPK